MRPLEGRVAVCAMVTALGLLATGCGQHNATTSPGAPSVGAHTGPSSAPTVAAGQARRQAAVNWANDYCGAVSELVRSVSTMPSIDPSTPRLASQTSSELLDVMVTGLDRTVDRLEGLDPAPSDGAEDVRRSAVTTYSEIRDRALGAKAELDAATGPQARRDALGSVREPLDDIGELNLLGGFESVPELREASSRAPACRRLTESGPVPRFDPPGS